jgi:hypothetical protein
MDFNRQSCSTEETVVNSNAQGTKVSIVLFGICIDANENAVNFACVNGP